MRQGMKLRDKGGGNPLSHGSFSWALRIEVLNTVENQEVNVATTSQLLGTGRHRDVGLASKVLAKGVLQVHDVN
jgi:hypothetical protein